jgi:hypothetical protein
VNCANCGYCHGTAIEACIAAAERRGAEAERERIIYLIDRIMNKCSVRALFHFVALKEEITGVKPLRGECYNAVAAGAVGKSGSPQAIAPVKLAPKRGELVRFESDDGKLSLCNFCGCVTKTIRAETLSASENRHYEDYCGKCKHIKPLTLPKRKKGVRR